MFVRLLLASLLADFVFQPSRLVEWKRQKFGGLLVHVGIVSVLSLVVGFGFWTRRYFALVVALGAVHLAIDWLKIAVDHRRTDGYWPLSTFLVDQVLHAASIAVLLSIFGLVPGRAAWTVLQQYIADPKYWIMASIYVGSVAGGSVLVRLFIQPFANKVTGKPGLLTAGAYIGMVERFLLTSLVASDQFGAVGFVLAAKSIARYRQLEDDPEFAEYYLIGTLTSSAIAVVAGIVVKFVLQ